jgi:hypothetical protein
MLSTLTGLDLAPRSNLARVSRPTTPSAPGLSDDALNPAPAEPSTINPLPAVSPTAAAAAAAGAGPGAVCGSSRGERSPRGVRDTPSTSATLGGSGMLLKRHTPRGRNPGRCCSSSCCREAGSSPCCCCCDCCCDSGSTGSEQGTMSTSTGESHTCGPAPATDRS